MQRSRSLFLTQWLHGTDRRPLVIRGARQVGKTWLVHKLAESEGLELIELNLEKHPEYAALFSSNEPKEIVLNLNAALNKTIDPKKSLLFLDEIQESPQLLAKLRWFAEDMPELPIIAAGSLLEFMLARHTISMPVGRINYMHLEPLSFEEFLLAKDEQTLYDYIRMYRWTTAIPTPIHDRLMKLVKEYIIIGGMPLAVSKWSRNGSLQEVNQIHFDLIATYRDDFAKYSGRIEPERLNEVMSAVPRYLGEKFVYSRVNPSVPIRTIKHALDLLCKARVCHRVMSSAANGLPLGAEIRAKYLKTIFLDVGLCSALLGLSLDQLTQVHELDLVNKGGIAEQLVGQMLRTLFPPYSEPELYYWHRLEKGSSAEVDYVIQYTNRVVPLEVKAGSTGRMKALHLFMGMKELATAVRAYSNVPREDIITMKDVHGKSVSYTLFSLPFYLLGQLHRLLGTQP